MKRFRVAAAVVATALVVHGVSVAVALGRDTPKKGDAKAFTPKDGRFSVVFPTKPASQEKKIDLPDGSTATLKCFMFESAKKDHALLVAYVDVPSDLDGTDDENLDNAVKGFAAAAGAGEPTSKRTLLNGHLGRTFECEIDDAGKFRGQMFLADKRLFQVVVVGSNEYVISDAANAFLKSFKLTGPAGDHKD